MRIHIWCILAPVFLISVKASLHDNVGQSFYETSQSSSPSPMSDYTQSPQPDVLDGMKEIVLFLTPDQVNALQAAGAVVKPYPEDEVDFTSMDQQLPQRIKPETRQHYQMQWNPNQNPQYNTELQNYYKLLNIQEINDNLSQTAAATIRTTERTTTTPRYRFTSTTTRPRFKEREYLTSPAPNRKASRTNYSNQNSNTERTPFQYYYVNQNFRNTPYNIRTPDNSPFSEFSFDRKTNPNFYSTPSSTITPSPSKMDYSNQNSNVEHTTHFEFYFENKKFKNTPSNIQVPYNSPSTKNTPNPHKNTPGFYSTPSSEITPNPYYTPSPKSTPNPNIAPSPKIIPSTDNSPSPKNMPKPYSTPKPNSVFNFNRSPFLYNTPSSSNTPNPYSTPGPYNTPNNFNSATRLQQSPYQPEKIQPNNYFQSNKKVQGNQYDQSPSSTPTAYSTTSTPRLKITPSPKNTPKPYSIPSPYKSSTRLPLFRYELEKEQSNNYFQTSKEIRRNQNHQSPSSTPISYSTPRPKITPSSKNTPNSYSTPSPYKSSTRLPLSQYEPEKEQPNNYFQTNKEIQGNQYHESPSSTLSPYNSPRSNITPRPNNTPSLFNSLNPYKTPTRLPQSLYQSKEKQSNNYFHSSKEIQENQYHQNPSSTPNPNSTPSPYKTPTHLPETLYQSEEKQPIDVQPSEDIQEDQNHQNPSNTPKPYSTPRPYKTPTYEPQSLYQPEENQSHNFQPSEESQRKQYQQPETATHQNEFSGTNRKQKEFTASSTKPHEDENVCTEETTEPEQYATQRTVEIGNRKVNKYSARNVYKPPVAVQVQEAQESVKPQTLAEVPTSYNAQTEPELNSGLEATTKRKKPLNSDNDHNDDLSSSPLQEEQETTTPSALPPLVRKPFEEEDYLSLLLAPLYKHQTISEIVSQHKDDLARSESNVNSKLQYLTNSHFNTNNHRSGFEKLPVDFNEQDGLAKHEAITRSPSVYVDENSETVETISQNLPKTSEFPIQEHSPEPKDWIASSPNPVPIELIRQFPSEEQVVNIGGGRNVFARTEKPLTIQTIAPLRLKHTTPEGLPLDSPILRPIWDH
ncbi:cell surface glycoprotein 1-like [Helicoverpa zea]|uniref:cell surface glycoprotein 1-like n=1 Tax=Helicoverpa zea TaxID=7113 RepID=UPI001F570FF8|nr:cell surface glycoprotein 1-like [Helicoverpa zea]